ncbi:MAG: beta-N-acetylhexosaminidase, partial [Gaiellaceae bacterium]|nr:beta-N-acetylhexosaminidase [Gaiellaceae bacterium]
FIRALQSQRIAATAKHFPGLGASRANTDDHRVTLRTVRLGPFRAAIAAGVELVMVSNAVYPRLDPSRVPAVFSHRIVGDLLRGTLGFRGVVVTDALDAPAPARMPHAPARALAAGVDLLLYTSGSSAHAGFLQLTQDVRTSPALEPDVARAVANIRALKGWLGRSC